MRFLVDESVGARLADWLATQGHDATAIARDYPFALPDTEVLALAHREGRVLITDDRDFGELVFHQRQPHAGVIYFQLRSQTFATRIRRLAAVLADYAEQLDQFIVVDDADVRVRQS